MKDEIKEIRDYIACPQLGDDHYGKWGALRLDQRKKIKQLLDYITNLQEELKSANESITWWQNRFNALQEENDRLNNEIKTLLKENSNKEKVIIKQNNIINRMEEDLKEMYLTFGEFNEEYTEKKIQELKGGE